jgi:hypothetical protein
MKDPALTTKEHLAQRDRQIAEIWALLGKMAKGCWPFRRACGTWRRTIANSRPT